MNRGAAEIAATMCLILVLTGCGKSAGPAAEADSGVATLPPDTPPDQVTGTFLEAVRTGDDQKANELLTPLARRKTADAQLVVAPPGSDTAKYAVGETALGDGVARVPTDWTDFDSGGQMRTDHIVWVLRRDIHGWRIAGMTAQVFPDRPPIDLDFENPEEMLSKQRNAEEEIARRDSTQPQATTRPANSASKAR